VKEIVGAYAGELVRLVNEMSPYLLLGFFFAALLRVVFLRRMVNRYMGQNNFRSVFNASMLGVPMPLCSCGVLPAGIGFYKSGASRGPTISFLISTPQTGVDSILATYSLLGLPFAIIRPVVAMVTGLLGGVVGNTAERKIEVNDDTENSNEELYERNVKEFFRYGFVELIQDVSRWLVIGVLVAALLAVVIPDDFFTSVISSEYLAMVLMILASVPLYICATGSIPIAAVLLMKGLSPGAALVLLMAGPATNVATMAVIGNALGKRSLWVYLGTIIGGALIFGILVNELLPGEWFSGAFSAGSGMMGHRTGWLNWTTSAILLSLIMNGYLVKLVSHRKERRNDREKTYHMKDNVLQFRVEGMTCDHCKTTVENGLRDLQGVTDVVADRVKSRVTIQSESVSDIQIKTVIEKLGYRFAGKL